VAEVPDAREIMPPQLHWRSIRAVAGDLALHPLDDVRLRTFLSLYEWPVPFQNGNIIF